MIKREELLPQEARNLTTKCPQGLQIKLQLKLEDLPLEKERRKMEREVDELTKGAKLVREHDRLTLSKGHEKKTKGGVSVRK